MLQRCNKTSLWKVFHPSVRSPQIIIHTKQTEVNTKYASNWTREQEEFVWLVGLGLTLELVRKRCCSNELKDCFETFRTGNRNVLFGGKIVIFSVTFHILFLSCNKKES